MSAYAKDTRVTAGPYDGYLVDQQGGFDWAVWFSSKSQLWITRIDGEAFDDGRDYKIGHDTADDAIFALIGDPQ